MIVSLIIIMRYNDRTAIALARKNNMQFEPEFRLAGAAYYGLLLPISLFWYGWAAEKKVHWMVSILGTVPYGAGMLGIFLSCQTYLVDAFSLYAASGVAAVRTSVSVAGAFLPLAGPPLYEALGLGWGNSVLGFIALALVPIPWLFFR
jgi:hypothetical protein